MKIINTQWKTFFVEEKNFLLKTDKAYFIQVPNSGVGLWISTKMAKYNELSKNGKTVYSFSINKDLTYKIVEFQPKAGGDIDIWKNTTQEIKGSALIDLIFSKIKK